MTLRDFLYEQDFEVQGRMIITEYDSKSEKRKVLSLNGSSAWDDFIDREIGYIYPEIWDDEVCIVIELKEVED